jgi:hypothetical protein
MKVNKFVLQNVKMSGDQIRAVITLKLMITFPTSSVRQPTFDRRPHHNPQKEKRCRSDFADFQEKGSSEFTCFISLQAYW